MLHGRGQLDFYGDKLLVTGNPDVDADVQLLAKLGLNGHRTTTTEATTPSLPEAHSAARALPGQHGRAGASKRFVARCQFNALHGQIGGQAVYPASLAGSASANSWAMRRKSWANPPKALPEVGTRWAMSRGRGGCWDEGFLRAALCGARAFAAIRPERIRRSPVA